jgi:hypothetical protein
MTEEQRQEYLDAAVEYVASHEHDYAQIFSNPSCCIHNDDEKFVMVQVWVGVPRGEVEDLVKEYRS